MKPHWWSRGRNADPYAIWARFMAWKLQQDLEREASR